MNWLRGAMHVMALENVKHVKEAVGLLPIPKTAVIIHHAIFAKVAEHVQPAMEADSN